VELISEANPVSAAFADPTKVWSKSAIPFANAREGWQIWEEKLKGPAFHGGGQFGLLSQSLDSRYRLSLSFLNRKELSLFPISNSEDLYGPSCVLVLARVLPYALSSVALAS
jgi:hypothetical protein